MVLDIDADQVVFSARCKKMAGRVFQREPNGPWYYAWSNRGREYRRSSHSGSRAIAERKLREVMKRIGAGYEASEDRLTFAAMIERLKHDYLIKGHRAGLSGRLAHLEPFFKGLRAPEITTEAVERYVAQRLGEKAAPATINRELAVVRRAANLSELSRKPRIAMLPENNARRDFLSGADFQKVLANLPEEFRDPVAFMYGTSWRQGQVAALEWRDVDLAARTVTARAETTKTGRPHTIPLTGEALAIIERARARRRLDCPLVFHREGHPLRLRGGTSPLRKAWAKACKDAGFAGHVLHCLRRSGVRNMIQAGVDPLTAMAQSGHSTMSMLSRYAIVTVDDLRRAMERTDAFVASVPESKVSTIR
jgi:integrase